MTTSPNDDNPENNHDPESMACGGCGAPAGTPCSPDCLGLADLEDRMTGFEPPPAADLPAHLETALDRATRAQAAWDAASDVNEMYVTLNDRVNDYVIDPTVLEASIGGAEVPDQFAVYLTHIYRDAYQDSLNQALHVVAGPDTAGEKAMQAQATPEQAEARRAQVEGAWDADLDKVRRMRNLAYPTGDQLQPPATDRTDPAPPPNPFTTKPERDHLPPPPRNPFQRPLDPGSGPER